MRRRPSTLLALAAAAFLVRGSVAEKLDGHSFSNPPDVNAMANDWYMAGTAIPTGKSLVMSPGATGRVGLLWSLTPLLTADFEVTMKVQITRPAPGKDWAKDAGLALFYSYDNGTEVMGNLMSEHGHNQAELIAGTWGIDFYKQDIHLLGFKSHWNGLGVFLFDQDPSPSISAAANDGKKDIRLNQGLPTADAVKFNPSKEVTVKLRVKPTGAVLEVDDGDGGGKINIPSSNKPGGFIGLTCYGGSHSGKPEVSSTIEVLSLTIDNMDKETEGEEKHSTPPPKQAKPLEEREDVFAAASSFKDLRAESDAIKDLTNMVFKLVVETQPMRLQMFRAIESLGKRISVMEKSFGELKDELDKKTGHNLGAEFEAIKAELTAISKSATQETKTSHEKLSALHEEIAHVHKSSAVGASIDKHLDKLSESNVKVLDQLQGEHQKMFGVSIAAIAFIIIAGLSLYNKFRCWEKKHVL
jgi:hypothetical protein